MTVDDAPRRPLRLPQVGHPMRLGMSRRERMLVVGHLLVLALALEDEEVAAAVSAVFGWEGALAAFAGTATTGLILALWGLLTLAWVRCTRDRG